MPEARAFFAMLDRRLLVRGFAQFFGKPRAITRVFDICTDIQNKMPFKYTFGCKKTLQL